MRSPAWTLTLVAGLLLGAAGGWTPASRADSSPAANFSLVLSPDGIQDSEKPALEKLLSDATALLPPRLKTVLTRQITVRFTRLDSTTTFEVPGCGPGTPMTNEGGGKSTVQIRGQVSAGLFQSESNIHEIQLNSVMIPEILKGPAQSTPYACGHKTLYALAMATLLHEVSHIYDFSNAYVTPERKKQLEYCRWVEENPRNDPASGSKCDLVLHRPRVVSYTPSFMSVVDWDDDSGTRLNYSALRSPDPYEYTLIEEEFAVNMEYFLLDPEFACRRPSEFEYLKDHFDFDPYPNRQCQLPTQVQLSSDSLGQAPGELVNLDPSRVYQIQFLFASQGPDLMSRWGHAMFRIVMCNKSRKQVGPDCLNDISDHIIVSYVANVGDWSISAWDGLTGKYPSQMFLYKLYPDIVNEYTVDEFRNLITLPLKLTDAEKTRFVQRVIEQYWQYSGKYYFLSNNCATEALHLLKGVIRDFGFQQWNVVTPLDLYDQLGIAGYIDKSLLDNAQAAQSDGYDFPSEEPVYETAFQRIKQVSPADVPVDNFEDYITKSNAADRLALYKKLAALGPEQAQGLPDRFFILETYIYHTQGNGYMDSLMSKLQQEGSDMEQKMSQVLQMSTDALPWNHAMGGYGIPLPEDQPTTATQAAQTDAQDAQLKSLYGDVMAWAQQNLASQSTELAAISANEQFFLSEMKKQLAAAAPSAQASKAP